MDGLYLEDLKDLNEDGIKDHLAEEYAGKDSGFDYGEPTDEEKSDLRHLLNDYSVLIAYEHVGSWGCDSSSYFLLEKAGEYFEVHGSHCSCFQFEGQFDLELTTKEYLLSDRFVFYGGGYDDNESENKLSIIESIKDHLK